MSVLIVHNLQAIISGINKFVADSFQTAQSAIGFLSYRIDVIGVKRVLVRQSTTPNCTGPIAYEAHMDSVLCTL